MWGLVLALAAIADVVGAGIMPHIAGGSSIAALGPRFRREWQVPVLTWRLSKTAESLELIETLRASLLKLASNSSGISRTNRGGWQSGGIGPQSTVQDLLEGDDESRRCRCGLARAHA